MIALRKPFLVFGFTGVEKIPSGEIQQSRSSAFDGNLFGIFSVPPGGEKRKTTKRERST